ncbi:hypothetical protein BJX70DRAFT_357628 [Aspergillus crustosus]
MPSYPKATCHKKSAKLRATWDPRVTERWKEYGYRELPTALHSPSTNESINNPDPGRPVTLTTPLSQKTFMYLRPNWRRHKKLGLPDSEDAATVDGPSPPHDPLSVPDMVGGLYAKQRFYRSEGMMAWKGLPHVRPNVLYVTGKNSALSQSGHLKRAAERTGTSIGGSGGMEYGRVKHVSLGVGHNLPFEKGVVGEAAAVVGRWIAEEVKRWEEDEKQIEEGWKDLPVADRVGFSEEWKAQMDAASKELPKSNKGTKRPASKL